MPSPLPIAVLLSGEGTTLDAIAQAIDAGELPARIVVVLSDRPRAPGLERARRRGLPTEVFPRDAPPGSDWSAAVDAVLRDRRAELVVLAGFLSVLPAPLLARWRGRVVNVHPSLLPRFGGPGMYGLRVHAAVLAAGETVSGATVHVVTEAVDAGPVLLSAPVPVRPDDTPETLRERVRPVERALVVEAIRRFATREWPLPYVSPGGPGSAGGRPRDPAGRSAPGGPARGPPSGGAGARGRACGASSWADRGGPRARAGPRRPSRSTGRSSTGRA